MLKDLKTERCLRLIGGLIMDFKILYKTIYYKNN